jgi:N-methylhydantoinase B
MTVAYAVDGHDFPPKGVRGGQPGARQDVFKQSGDGSVVPAELTATLTLQPGERIISHTNGGGGYGDPCERDAEYVRADVEAGLISPDRALDVYEVAVTKESEIRWRVDQDRTAAGRRDPRVT